MEVPGMKRLSARRGLGILLGVAAAVGLGAGLLALMRDQTLGESGACVEALGRLRESRAAAEALGTPIERRFGIQGEVRQERYSGQAVLRVPVRGPQGAGVLKVGARLRPHGRWEFQRLLLEVQGRAAPVDLLAERAPAE